MEFSFIDVWKSPVFEISFYGFSIIRNVELSCIFIIRIIGRFYHCKIINHATAQKNLFGFLRKFSPQASTILADTPKPCGQKNFKPTIRSALHFVASCPDLRFCLYRNFYGIWQRKTTPQLYE